MTKAEISLSPMDLIDRKRFKVLQTSMVNILMSVIKKENLLSEKLLKMLMKSLSKFTRFVKQCPINLKLNKINVMFPNLFFLDSYLQKCLG
jgi:hypothetical protein